MEKGEAPPRWLPFVVLGIGLLAIAFGAILARLAQGGGVPSVVVATTRLGLAALIITPLALLHSRPALRSLTRRQWLMALAAGACLALHFGIWISSLEYTSVASSTALVTTNPLWIGIASFFLFGEKQEDGKKVLAEGVIEEFEIAHELGLTVIPVGVTGSAAKILHERVLKDFKSYFPHWGYRKQFESLAKPGTPGQILGRVLDLVTKLQADQRITP